MAEPTDRSTTEPDPDEATRARAFEAIARTPPRSAFADLLGFIRATRRYWLAPILVVLILFAGLLALSATPAGPFVYTLF